MKPKKMKIVKRVYKLQQPEREMNTIILLIGRRLIAAVENEMKQIDYEISERQSGLTPKRKKV